MAGCVALLLVGQLGGASPLAAAGGWKKSRQKAGVTLYERALPGHSLPELKAVTLLHASRAKVLQVLSDVPRYRRWIPRCRQSRLLWRRSAQELGFYQRFHLPWPLHDRDMVVAVQARALDPAGPLHIDFATTRQKAPPTPKRVVRIRHMRGHYRLESLGPQRTRLSYQVYVDLGGSLPRWFLRWVARDVPWLTVRALRKELHRR
ncbi:MAG: START domain-containing protein [Polyangiales bacterium]